MYTLGLVTEPKSATDRAHHLLRTEILDGSLAPGSVLYEVEQADRLGMSRTPVRAALSRLRAEGLVGAGGRGVTVTDVQAEDVESLFELRTCLESHAAQLAAGRASTEEFAGFAEAFREARELLVAGGAAQDVVDEYFALIRRFDTAIDDATENRYLVEALATLRTHVSRVRHMAGSSRDRLVASADEHALIAEAIAQHDPVLADHATHVHLHNSLQHFRGAFSRRRSA